MSSRNWLNLLLLLLLLGLAALFYFDPGKETGQTSVLTAVDTAQVRQLKIERPQGESLLLQRQGDGWRLVEPVVAAAREVSVRQLLDILSWQSRQQYPAAGLELVKYGLQPPQATLFADETALAFGRINPLNNRLYVMVDDVMHMVDENDTGLLTAPWSQFVSLSALPLDAQVESLSLPGLGQLQREEAGWRYDGDAAPASADQMQMLVDSWRAAQAFDVAAAVSRHSVGEVVLTLADKSQARLSLAQEGDELILMDVRSGLEYRFAEPQSKRLLQWPRLPEEGSE